MYIPKEDEIIKKFYDLLKQYDKSLQVIPNRVTMQDSGVLANLEITVIADIEARGQIIPILAEQAQKERKHLGQPLWRLEEVNREQTEAGLKDLYTIITITKY